ncbi:MAG TPA: LamG-like jellyroll fold domain-containing protein, partial [Polyangia bacterium]|nr:LamG-like jellyroll fold domain-containing protein [Polyangia bacterium]
GSGGAGGAAGKGGALGSGGAGGMAAGCASPATYDQTVLCDQPAAYWAMKASGATEPDLVGHDDGTYKGAAPTAATLPNKDPAAHFNGSSGYLSIPSSAALSVPTTHSLTWEGWIKADTLQFANASSDGYVDWMGKCADYGPTCEWEARMYSTTTSESRPNRMSAYIFNSSAGLGSAADWQPADNLIKANTWYYVVGEYTTLAAPSDCQNTSMYPGSINVWVNGVEWDHGEHGQTGCMSQYDVIPTANDSPLNIGTMAQDTWFPGAVGKVAVYDKLLTPAQIAAHYRAMTGESPTGSCSATCSF